MEIGLIVAIIVAVAMYYGVFSSVEVTSDMVAAELRDAKRTQTSRIVKKYVNYEHNDEQFNAAKANIVKLDALEL